MVRLEDAGTEEDKAVEKLIREASGVYYSLSYAGVVVCCIIFGMRVMVDQGRGARPFCRLPLVDMGGGYTKGLQLVSFAPGWVTWHRMSTNHMRTGEESHEC